MQTTGQKCRLSCIDRNIVKMVGNISVRKECNMSGREMIKGSGNGSGRDRCSSSDRGRLGI